MVVAYVSDLVFGSKITSAARAAEVGVRVVRAVDEIEDGAGLVLVDLEASGAVQAIERCGAGQRPPRIVAFGPHVREDLFAAAREAGADEVLARSAFVQRLPELLKSS